LRSQKRLVGDIKNLNATKGCDGFPVLVLFDRNLDPPRRLHPKGQRKRKSDKTAGLVSEFSFPYGEEANPKSQNNREKAVGQPSSATLFEGPESENQPLDKINEGETNSGDQRSRHVGTVLLCSAAGQYQYD
jgi:hypothetical protein